MRFIALLYFSPLSVSAQLQRASVLEFSPTMEFPALQYLERVDKDSMADKAGLRRGDFILEVSV